MSGSIFTDFRGHQSGGLWGIVMRLTKTAVGLLAWCSAVFLPSGAWAWGSEGHRIIALIAADRLTPAARAGIADLLGGDARRRLEEASTWADEIRHDRPETAPWHYVNIEISATGYDAVTDCPAENCVIAQVLRDARIVADDQLQKPLRTEALRFLVHFVGDLHQPLHCADNHDRGGNEVRVVIGAKDTNLHAVWDTDVVAALGNDPDQIASALMADITQEEERSWSRGSAVDWANESFGIAKRVIYSGMQKKGGTAVPIILPQDYAARERSVVAMQLEKAGVRLALLLNNAFASPAHFVSDGAVEPAAASSYVGETATIRGNVVEVHRSRSGVTFLDMGDRYPDNAFTGVIFSEDAGKFADVGSLRGKVVEITGVVRRYRGKPEIILKEPNQLKVE